ncbi:unnamed protein product [Dibothriocephalus latus]|uniref:RRM domain-containing protein n=1 Tax=Dibothriocephalus latus TaxID=60516 RepID=A0A3P7LAN6_DIBLA|nr:unnamed protein product [Dibothriocephalus latus]
MPRSDRQAEGYRIFIGGVDPRVGKVELEREFDRFGPIVDVWVARNPPGFAFIVYKYLEDAEKAIRRMDRSSPFGSRLRVEHAANSLKFKLEPFSVGKIWVAVTDQDHVQEAVEGAPRLRDAEGLQHIVGAHHLYPDVATEVAQMPLGRDTMHFIKWIFTFDLYKSETLTLFSQDRFNRSFTKLNGTGMYDLPKVY